MNKPDTARIKKFAKKCVVQPDHTVTVEMWIDIRHISTVPTHPPIPTLSDYSMAGVVLYCGQRANTSYDHQKFLAYFENLVDHGSLLVEDVKSDETEDVGLQVKMLDIKGTRVKVRLAIPPENMARWLMATGFPQLSYAKNIK